jgi:hypothetical protein
MNVNLILLQTLEKKDPQHFFAWPVTDNIAPGYSSIISQPMDFSTMRQKNEDNLYATLPEFLVSSSLYTCKYYYFKNKMRIIIPLHF